MPRIVTFIKPAPYVLAHWTNRSRRSGFASVPVFTPESADVCRDPFAHADSLDPNDESKTPASITGVYRTSKSASRVLPNISTRAYRSDLPTDPFDRVFFREDTTNPTLVAGRVFKSRERYEGYDPSTEANPTIVSRHPMVQALHNIAYANRERKRFTLVQATPLVRAVLNCVQRNGFISGFRDYSNEQHLVVELKYYNDFGVIGNVQTFGDLTEGKYWDRPYIRNVLSSGSVSDDRLFIFQTFDGQVLSGAETLTANIQFARLLAAVVPPYRAERHMQRLDERESWNSKPDYHSAQGKAPWHQKGPKVIDNRPTL